MKSERKKAVKRSNEDSSTKENLPLNPRLIPSAKKIKLSKQKAIQIKQASIKRKPFITRNNRKFRRFKPTSTLKDIKKRSVQYDEVDKLALSKMKRQ